MHLNCFSVFFLNDLFTRVLLLRLESQLYLDRAGLRGFQLGDRNIGAVSGIETFCVGTFSHSLKLFPCVFSLNDLFTRILLLRLQSQLDVVCAVLRGLQLGDKSIPGVSLSHCWPLCSMAVSSLVFVCLMVGCLTSQQHASVSQGRICSIFHAATLR